MRTEKGKTPEPSKVIGTFSNQKGINGKAKRKFYGRDNPMYLRAIAALMLHSISRQELASVAGCSNGLALAPAGLDVPDLKKAGAAQ